jgi:hypothetical protein
VLTGKDVLKDGALIRHDDAFELPVPVEVAMRAHVVDGVPGVHVGVETMLAGEVGVAGDHTLALRVSVVRGH